MGINNTKNIIISLISRYGVFFLSITVGFLLVPYLVNALGHEAYGILVLVGNVTGYLKFTSFGSGTATQQLIAKTFAKKNLQKLNIILSTSFYFAVGTALVSALLGTVIVPYFAKWMNISEEYSQIATIAMAIGVLSFSSGQVLGIWGSVQVGLKLMYLNDWLACLRLLVYASLTICAIELGYGLIGVILGTLISDWLNFSLMFLSVRRKLTNIKINFSNVSKDSLKEILSPGFYFFLNTFILLFLFNSDNIIISVFLSATAVTTYAIATRLFRYISGFIALITDVLMPHIGEAVALKDYKRLQKMHRKGLRLSTLFAFPIYTLISLHGETIIKAWVGKENTITAIIITLLSIKYLIKTLEHSSMVVLQGMLEHKLATIISFVSSILYILLSVILVQYLEQLGIALAGAIIAIFFAWVNPFLASRTTRDNYFQILRNEFTYSVFWSFPASIIFLLAYILNVNSILDLMAYILLAALVTMVVIWQVGFSDDERATLIRHFKHNFIIS